jgi:hypothetical protein
MHRKTLDVVSFFKNTPTDSAREAACTKKKAHALTGVSPLFARYGPIYLRQANNVSASTGRKEDFPAARRAGTAK